MNERIKQLAKKSGVWYVTSREELVEDFAQLIVRECVEQIITGPNGPAYYAVEAAVRVKKHFGVEE